MWQPRLIGFNNSAFTCQCCDVVRKWGSMERWREGRRKWGYLGQLLKKEKCNYIRWVVSWQNYMAHVHFLWFGSCQVSSLPSNLLRSELIWFFLYVSLYTESLSHALSFSLSRSLWYTHKYTHTLVRLSANWPAFPPWLWCNGSSLHSPSPNMCNINGELVDWSEEWDTFIALS